MFIHLETLMVLFILEQTSHMTSFIPTSSHSSSVHGYLAGLLKAASNNNDKMSDEISPGTLNGKFHIKKLPDGCLNKINVVSPYCNDQLSFH